MSVVNRGNVGSLKNRVGTNKTSHHLQAQLRLNTGISQKVIIQACMGDLKAAKFLGKCGEQGRMISEMSPAVREQVLSAMKGAEDLNVTFADIYQQAGISGAVIEKAVQATALQDIKLQNTLLEIQQEYDIAFESEDTRHNNAMDRMALKAWIDSHTSQVNNNHQMLQQELRLPVLQAKEDYAHRKTLSKEYLINGSQVNEEFLPKKTYADTGVIKKMTDFIGGFLNGI